MGGSVHRLFVRPLIVYIGETKNANLKAMKASPNWPPTMWTPPSGIESPWKY